MKNKIIKYSIRYLLWLFLSLIIWLPYLLGILHTWQPFIGWTGGALLFTAIDYYFNEIAIKA